VALPQFLTLFQEYESLVLGLVIIVSMIYMRDGIVPTVSKRLAKERP
jgi:branched-chain amino acid transport system permease protein